MLQIDNHIERIPNESVDDVDGHDDSVIATVDHAEADDTKDEVEETSDNAFTHTDHLELGAEGVSEVVPATGHAEVDEEDVEDCHQNSPKNNNNSSSF